MSPLDSLAGLAIQLPWNGTGVGGWTYRMSGEEFGAEDLYPLERRKCGADLYPLEEES